MTKQTLIRTIVLILALFNQFMVIRGVSILPIEEEQINDFISVSFTIIAAAVAWWKNNSFTPEAIEADKYLTDLRNKQ